MGQPDQIQVWVEAVRRGDQSAAGKLLVTYYPLLRTRAAARMDRTVQAKHEPDDILQQVYLQVMRHLERFDGQTVDVFLNWVFTILDNELINAWRAAHRKRRDVNREQPIDGGDAASYWNLLDHVYADSDTPSHIIRKDEAFDALLACVAVLSDSHRRVIRLRFLEGLSVSETAARLYATKPAIVALTKRALDALRRSMDHLGEFTRGS
ncbi:MAG: sigma-70 family RNA polymerase sigma factor [Phycisphaerae bacterium]|nr:sigma-70 family RNA polymerase sigma factor [Phycisphaerae bacterium]